MQQGSEGSGQGQQSSCRLVGKVCLAPPQQLFWEPGPLVAAAAELKGAVDCEGGLARLGVLGHELESGLESLGLKNPWALHTVPLAAQTTGLSFPKHCYAKESGC